MNDLEKLKWLQYIFEKRKKNLKTEYPFEIKNEKTILDKYKISYPKDFVIIKEDTLINILEKLDIKYKKDQNSLYKYIYL